MHKQVLALVGVVLLSAPFFGTVGCKPSSTATDGPKFAFVTNGVDPFWTIAAAGARQAEEDLDVDVDVVFPNGLADQTRKLEDLVVRGVDGIAVSPINSPNQTDALNKVAESSILITHDSDAPESNRRLYIGMDNYSAGWMCGEMVRNALPEGGKVMLFIGRVDQDNAQARRQGCIDALLGRTKVSTRRDPANATPSSEDGRYQVLGTLTDRLDVAKAKANAEDALTRHPDLAAMVGLFASNPPAILAALERAGKVGDVKVIGFDENETTLQGIVDGDIVGTVVQNPYQYGYESIRILEALRKGDESVIPEGAFIDVPPRAITKDNVQEFWDTLKKQLAADE